MKFRSNEEQQKLLDQHKLIENKFVGEDMSGALPHCYYCDSQLYITENSYYCKATEKEIQANSLCAKAYNEMNKKMGKHL